MEAILYLKQWFESKEQYALLKIPLGFIPDDPNLIDDMTIEELQDITVRMIQLFEKAATITPDDPNLL